MRIPRSESRSMSGARTGSRLIPAVPPGIGTRCRKECNQAEIAASASSTLDTRTRVPAPAATPCSQWPPQHGHDSTRCCVPGRHYQEIGGDLFASIAGPGHRIEMTTRQFMADVAFPLGGDRGLDRHAPKGLCRNHCCLRAGQGLAYNRNTWSDKVNRVSLRGGRDPRAAPKARCWSPCPGRQ